MSFGCGDVIELVFGFVRLVMFLLL